MISGSVEYRELWTVQFATRTFKRHGKGVIDMAGEDAVGTVNVWAVSGDDAVELVKADAKKENVPWMGLVGLVRVGLIEKKILNQPEGGMSLREGIGGDDTPSEGT